MAHVIPTLRTAMHPTYIPPAMQRKSDIPPSTGDPSSATDFGTELKNQTGPAADETAPTPRMIGTVSPTPLPSLTPTRDYRVVDGAHRAIALRLQSVEHRRRRNRTQRQLQL